MKIKDERSLIKHIVSGITLSIIILIFISIIFESVLIIYTFGHTLVGKLFITCLQMLGCFIFGYIIYLILLWSNKK